MPSIIAESNSSRALFKSTKARGISEQIRGMPKSGAKSISSSTNASSALLSVVGSSIDSSFTDDL